MRVQIIASYGPMQVFEDVDQVVDRSGIVSGIDQSYAKRLLVVNFADTLTVLIDGRPVNQGSLD